MELKEGIVHALTIVAFPLQIVAWACFAGRMQLIVPIIVAIFVHALYYIRVIVRGENRYKKPFFVYEIIVAVAMCVTFIVKLFGYFPEFWIFIAPLFVQVGTCVGLYMQNRKDEEMEDGSVDILDEKENERFKKWIMSAVAIVAFPTQLVFYSFMLANGYGFVLVVMMIVGLIVSITAHFLYFYNVFWRRQKEYKMHIFYFEVSVAIIQAMLLSMPDLRSKYGNLYFHYEDLWLSVLPLLVQVITCTYLYMENDKTESVEGVERNMKNIPREFAAFPVVSKTNDYEAL